MNCHTATRSFVSKLGIQFPIIQAPMAGTSTPKLAAAVSNSGGLGSIAIGAMSVETARKSIRELRALTAKPFNVNLFCHAQARSNPSVESQWISYLTPYFTEYEAVPPTSLQEIYESFIHNESMFKMLLKEMPPVISFHFGLPDKKQIDAFREKKIFLLATATSVKEAKFVEDAGIDAIVAQGYEAGGHRGVFYPDEYDECLSTFALVRLLATNTSLPVIAAGGIMDGAGIDAVLALGARAVQMGTAFIGCPESSADEWHRKLLLQKSTSTTMTRAISGRPARSFINQFTKLDCAKKSVSIPSYPRAYDIGKALNAAAKKKGSYEFAAHWAGQGAPLARILPAKELMEVLRKEMDMVNFKRITDSVQKEG